MIAHPTHTDDGEREELDDMFDSIRQTCDDCEHPRCLAIIKSAKTTILDNCTDEHKPDESAQNKPLLSSCDIKGCVNAALCKYGTLRICTMHDVGFSNQFLARDKAQRQALVFEIEKKLDAAQKASLPDSPYRKGFDECRTALHQLTNAPEGKE